MFCVWSSADKIAFFALAVNVGILILLVLHWHAFKRQADTLQESVTEFEKDSSRKEWFEKTSRRARISVTLEDALIKNGDRYRDIITRHQKQETKKFGYLKKELTGLHLIYLKKLIDSKSHQQSKILDKRRQLMLNFTDIFSHIQASLPFLVIVIKYLGHLILSLSCQTKDITLNRP